MLRYEAMIFDLDGTLLDSLPDIEQSINHTLKHLELPLLSNDEVQSYIGNGVHNLIELCLPNGKDDIHFEKCLTMFRKHYIDNMTIKTLPYEGIYQALAELDKYGCKMAVVSNKVDGAVKELVKHYFSQYITIALGECAAIPRKPDPSGLLQAAQLLNVSPSKCLYVGDSPSDIFTADKAGMISVGVTWGYRSEDELRKANATFIATAPSQLPEFLNPQK